MGKASPCAQRSNDFATKPEQANVCHELDASYSCCRLEPLIISEEEKKKDEEFLKSFNESDLYAPSLQYFLLTRRTDADDDSTVLTLTDESTTLTLTELAPTVIHEEISLVLTEDAPLVLVEETVTLLSMDIKEDLQLTEVRGIAGMPHSS